MSLIEKAAKRLEELKRSGVDISDVSVTGDRDTSTKASVIPVSSSSTLLDALPNEPNGARARSFPRAEEDTSDPAKPIFQIDLKKLAAAGCVTPDAPRSRIAEEFRHLKRTLLANASGKSTVPVKNANLVMITSAVPGEGKTFSAVSLAMSLAMEVDRTVLLVDADVARPALPALLELPESRGLLDALERRSASLSDLLIHTNIEKLTILPSGATRPTATELLASDAMNNLLDELSSRYPDRIIIFDSPPLLATTEARALATHMGQIVFVVNAERTLRSDVAQGLAAIEACPIKLLLLNKANTTSSGGYGGYGYYGNEQT
jgi:protein-tyrosine kinase